MRGKWALQIVGDVRDEVTLLLGGCFEPGEHGVHRRGQAADLVIDPVAGHTGLQVLGRDPVNLGADVVQAAQGASEQQPDDHSQREPDQWDANPQRASQCSRCFRD